MVKIEKVTEAASELMTQEQVDDAMELLKTYHSLIFGIGYKNGFNIGIVLGVTASAVTFGVTKLVFRKQKKDQK